MELNTKELQSGLKDSPVKVDYSFKQDSNIDEIKAQFNDTKESFSKIGNKFRESSQEWNGYTNDVKGSFEKWTKEGLLNSEDKDELKDTLMDGIKDLANKLASPVAFVFDRDKNIGESLLNWVLEDEFFLHEEYISTSFGMEQYYNVVSRPLEFKNGKRGLIGSPTQNAYSAKEEAENAKLKEKVSPSIFGDDDPKVPDTTKQTAINKEVDSIISEKSLFDVDQNSRFSVNSQGIWDKVLTSAQELFQLVDFTKPYLVRDIAISSSENKGAFNTALSKININNSGKIALDGRLKGGLQLDGIKVNTMAVNWHDTTSSVMIKNIASHNQTSESNKVSFSFRDSFTLEIYRVLAYCLEQIPIVKGGARVNLSFNILVPIGRLEKDQLKRTFTVTLKDCYVVEVGEISITQDSVNPLEIKTSLIYGSIAISQTTSQEV